MIIEHEVDYRDTRHAVTQGPGNGEIVVNVTNSSGEQEFCATAVITLGCGNGRVDQQIKSALMTIEEELQMRFEQEEAIDIARKCLGLSQAMGFPVKDVLTEGFTEDAGAVAIMSWVHAKRRSLLSALEGNAISVDARAVGEIHVKVLDSILARFGSTELQEKAS